MGILALTLVVGFCVTRSQLSRGESRRLALEQEKAALAAQIAQLKDEIAFAQTDEYVERVARDELGLIQPGEVRYVIGSN